MAKPGRFSLGCMSVSVSPPPVIRPLLHADLPGVLDIQAACYGEGFVEPVDAFANKLGQAPDTCWGVDHRGQLRAYLFCLPVTPHNLPALHATAWQRPAEPGWLYLHDMAVHPEARALGLASRLLDAARQEAHALGCDAMVLVAVQGSVPYWARHGFSVAEAEGPLADKLCSFGDEACFMQQNLR